MLKSYPLNIPKVQSKGSKISNLGQNFIFTENCTPNYPYEPFYLPLTFVQINIFEEPQNIFSTKIPDPKLSSQPPVFLAIECPPGDGKIIWFLHYSFHGISSCREHRQLSKVSPVIDNISSYREYPQLSRVPPLVESDFCQTGSVNKIFARRHLAISFQVKTVVEKT